MTFTQICEVKSLYGATLDDDLKKKIEQKYPELLEKPKDEEE